MSAPRTAAPGGGGASNSNSPIPVTAKAAVSIPSTDARTLPSTGNRIARICTASPSPYRFTSATCRRLPSPVPSN